MTEAPSWKRSKKGDVSESTSVIEVRAGMEFVENEIRYNFEKYMGDNCGLKVDLGN